MEKYKTKELTPENMICGLGACPAIYEVTPEDAKCICGSCPSIYGTEGSYLIVGEGVEPKEFGLAGKVGKGEVLIRVPKGLIDKIKR